jgi:hypothetical protein
VSAFIFIFIFDSISRNVVTSYVAPLGRKAEAVEDMRTTGESHFQHERSSAGTPTLNTIEQISYR